MSNPLHFLAKFACHCHMLVTVLMLATCSHEASATKPQIIASLTPVSGGPSWASQETTTPFFGMESFLSFLVFSRCTRASRLCCWMQISAAQKDVGSNHAVSGLKFKILRHFLQLGYAVLLSDVDIVTLQNPFDHLYRDSDVEAMSDGWSNDTAYGKCMH